MVEFFFIKIEIGLSSGVAQRRTFLLFGCLPHAQQNNDKCVKRLSNNRGFLRTQYLAAATAGVVQINRAGLASLTLSPSYPVQQYRSRQALPVNSGNSNQRAPLASF